MKDFAEELRFDKFWDKDTDKVFREQGFPLIDRALQNREEVAALCEWIAEHQIKSYLEIGIWTGRLLKILHRLFKFNTVAGCDLGIAKGNGFEIDLPDEVAFFEGNSHSPIYENWRNKLGHIDLTFIDSNHSYEHVRRDFEINRCFPHRYFAFHGIAGSAYTGEGVKTLWEELEGHKVEIIKPHTEIDLEEPTMGIGIWWERSEE